MRMSGHRPVLSTKVLQCVEGRASTLCVWDSFAAFNSNCVYPLDERLSRVEVPVSRSTRPAIQVSASTKVITWPMDSQVRYREIDASEATWQVRAPQAAPQDLKTSCFQLSDASS